jgi:undecaprenyl-diphosphatase
MAVAGSLLITALILAIGERLGRRVQAIGQNPLGQIRLLDAWLVGLAQAVAIAPGISRSGATIAAGLSLGLQRDVAARFSFLLSAPAVFGAGLVQLVDLIQTDNLAAEWLQLLVGFLVAAVTGFLCIHFLLAYLRRGKLYVFAGYCAFIGLGTLIATYLLNDPG